LEEESLSKNKAKAEEVNLRNENKDDKCAICEFLKSIECSRSHHPKLGIRENSEGSLFLEGRTVGFPGSEGNYYISLYWLKEALKARGYKLVAAKGQFGSRKLKL
jgi:hypothetical protein